MCRTRNDLLDRFIHMPRAIWSGAISFGLLEALKASVEAAKGRKGSVRAKWPPARKRTKAKR